MRCGRKIQRGILLNLTGLQCDPCNVEACNLRGLNVYKLSGVETPRDPLQRARQSICSGGFLRMPQASSRAGAVAPGEVPAPLTNHRIEVRRCDLIGKRPVFAAGLPQWIHAIRKDTLVAQEDGMQLHTWALLDTVGGGLVEPATGLAGAMAAPLYE